MRSSTVANEQGSFTTPSFVSFTDEERLIGEAAKNQAAMNPANTIFDIKSVPVYQQRCNGGANQSVRRLIGRRFDDQTVKKDIESWPFKVVDQGGNPMVQVEYLKETKTFSPQEISSMVLMKVCLSVPRQPITLLRILDERSCRDKAWQESQESCHHRTCLF